MIRTCLLTSLLILTLLPALAQDYPHEIQEYPFIRYDLNKLEFPGDSSGFSELFAKFDTVIYDGYGQLDILHMGGSHVQAGVFSSRMRYHLQTVQPGLNSYRGFVFPFRVARTNNPVNYRVSYTGNWEGCRNVERRKACTLGLSGMLVSTNTAGASIKVRFHPDYLDQPFDHLLVYHKMDSDQFSIQVDIEGVMANVNDSLGYTELSFPGLMDSVELKFVQTVERQTGFTLYGLKFANSEPGFAYHATGVNGADVPAFLRCELLPLHLSSVVPDLVIFGIGINDANTSHFNASYFKSNYDSLVQKILAVNPNAQFIFLTNNDSYYRRRYANPNGPKVRTAMRELAEKYNAAVWDLFGIMGGLDSINQWQEYGLAQSDRIHFTRAGYNLVGDLLFSAIIRSYEFHLRSTFTN